MSYFSRLSTRQLLSSITQRLSSMGLYALVGLIAGSLSSLFLFLLHRATATRINYPWLLYFLPIAGIFIVATYSKYGKEIESENKLISEAMSSSQKRIPIRTIPFILLSTLMTHIFGGSSGREGTAVQMGAAVSDLVARFSKKMQESRSLFIASGLAAGFGAVFGTPLAGAIFGMEYASRGTFRYKALFPCIFSAIIADQVSRAFGIQHDNYLVPLTPELNLVNLLWALAAAVAFGLCAIFFKNFLALSQSFMVAKIKSPQGRAFWGGSLIVTATLILGTDRYLGLGIPVIAESFENPTHSFDFIFKTIFTVLTLSTGFKGGQFTPLFFIGATLGSTLSQVIHLPVGLMAAMGFVGVFSGVSRTPLACTMMGLELFGSENGAYLGLSCLFSFIIARPTGQDHA